ncbi:hypothetical protein [Moraxella nasicaprae]|uniref:Uncharacterized protein n=1 Tax=Moraxella nasicaprae TaxID=2904122 RepID=A0ABY6F381_9GAMM|nr:hypothetical protein [Moraxella nasicaprae]UXZ04538.1 hypothetical protein LU297_08120 [Moraxella nasicaprae]
MSSNLKLFSDCKTVRERQEYWQSIEADESIDSYISKLPEIRKNTEKLQRQLDADRIEHQKRMQETEIFRKQFEADEMRKLQKCNNQPRQNRSLGLFGNLVIIFFTLVVLAILVFGGFALIVSILGLF